MRSLTLIITAAAVLLPSCQALRGRTETRWDCCKPACGWKSNLVDSKATGQLTICSKDDAPLPPSEADSRVSSCDATNPGNAYTCSTFQPRPVSDALTYAFAVTKGMDNCCRCFELSWTDGPAVGKRLRVQVINEGGNSTDANSRTFMILTPGGGVGPNIQGCEAQYGYDWGRRYGGVVKAEDCVTLPERLQAGCYWRWNWARGDVNGWGVDYERIECPRELTDVSGCKA
ncbi:RlpA-like double-psi beta-barrel-protein domain-containing protein-containing protein [Podospora conica]|nr:RlpA-like double-psi beta-barrel-protein domain-containing protein-containing protein [Schizothecium conicum]